MSMYNPEDVIKKIKNFKKHVKLSSDLEIKKQNNNHILPNTGKVNKINQVTADKSNKVLQFT